MHRAVRSVAVLGLVVTLLVSAVVMAGGDRGAAHPEATGPGTIPAVRADPWTPRPASHTDAVSDSRPSASSLAFDRRVAETASSLARAGVPEDQIRVPYVGRWARIVDGAVVPGYATSPGPGASGSDPAPSGITYYGESNTTGTLVPTTLDASSLAGTVTVASLDDVSLDANTPNVSGFQLNAVMTNVTLQGGPGYEFWTQNTIDFYQENDTINFGEDTWNFSGPSAIVPDNSSTILAHDPAGAVVGGIYLGLGPFLKAPLPFSLTLYLNSSLTSTGEQELWYNYTLAAAHSSTVSGNYDWVEFNSTNPSHPASVPLAPFEASGTHLDPIGLPNDFEFDVGIGSYDGTNLDVLSANMSVTLDYCPALTAACSSSQFRSVPAAEDFGGETGETSSGLCVSYTGTTVSATAGPYILRGLWGFSAEAGSAPGATPVTNSISVSGDPERTTTAPYVFVFLNGSSALDSSFEWAPDVPTWYLAPGSYAYSVLLADYNPVSGTLVVGSSPTALSLVLDFNRTIGVYTPLWALSNSELAGISNAGNGTVGDQYRIFNDPAAAEMGRCPGYGGALDPIFFAWNDFLFPVFAGILFEGTSAYVDVDHAVNFCVGSEYWGVLGVPPNGPTTMYFYLQLEFIETHHVTLANDPGAMGWPAMFEISTLAGLLPPTENPFPTANVVIWNSTDDLVMANVFDPSAVVPTFQAECAGICPAITCNSCAAPDGLLLYGGTRNTVWGNTFEDATSVAEPQPQPYAGLAEAENGDLLYNNNFSVDNPTVYLPFDVYNDSCGYGYAGGCLPNFLPTYSDTWNVSSQSASHVVETVNGFPLSGNVLGPACALQGGNYWNDYGNALNPLGTLPFTNVYNYSGFVGLLPGSPPADQPSIRVGGDFAPLLRTDCPSGTAYPVSFVAEGLPGGVNWSVDIHGYLETSSTPWINYTLPDGTYEYNLTVSNAPGTVRSGSFTVDGSSLTIEINFTSPAALWQVTIDQLGLPSGTPWYLNLSGEAPIASTGTSTAIDLSNGTYPYTLASSTRLFAPSAARGTLTIAGKNLTLDVEFHPVVYAVGFVETGLPSGTNWSVTITGGGYVVIFPRGGGAGNAAWYASVTSWSDAGTWVGFFASNGSYSYTVGDGGASGYSASGGSFAIMGASIANLTVAFGPPGSALPCPTALALVLTVGILTGVVVAIVVTLSLRRGGGGPAPPGRSGPPPPPPA